MIHSVSRTSVARERFGTLSGLLFTLAVSLAGPAIAQLAFEDRTNAAGIFYVGESFGSSWGDVNADGHPDLFVNHHREKPSLYVNNGDGTFTDKANDVIRWRQQPHLDQHGFAWGDFNKDGFQDLLGSMGARDNGQLFENFSGLLVDRAADYGVEFLSWPGRMPMWLDGNIDGQLDFTVLQRGRAQLFAQSSGAFNNVSGATGFVCDDTQYGQLADINGDGQVEILCAEQPSWPDKVFNTATVPFTNVTGTFPNILSVNDSIIGDFNRDLQADVFVLRGILRPSGAALDGTNQVEAQLITEGNKQEAFSFHSTGIITVNLDWNSRNVSRMFIGANGTHPTGFGGTDPIVFTLDPANPDTWGLKTHNPATDNGIYMGYDTATNIWTFQLSPGGPWSYVYWTLDSTAPISSLTVSGIGGAELTGIQPALLISSPSGYTNQSSTRGFNPPINCAGVTAGDFDNDMDEDIYVVCRGGVTNEANRLYENQGDGTFLLVPNAAGAAGPIGLNVGQAEAVTTADYDGDGCLDLYVTNGLGLYPEPPYSIGGPDKLYRNVCNTNSWIQLQLRGTTSNGDGIGARVLATTGGVTQLREQNGGYHRWSQDFQRLHFGLGSNATVNLSVRWPNGTVEIFDNVAANRIYRVIEGAGIEELVLGDGSPVSISIGDVSVNESTGVASFPVTLSRSTVASVTADFATLNGTAMEPGDYVSNSGTVSFAPTQTSQTINVTVIDDSDIEQTENFTVRLSNPSHAIIAQPVGTATITDNDSPNNCGTPIYDPFSESGFFMWIDCNTGEWIMRAVAGGTPIVYNGDLTSNQNILSVTPFSIEAHDTFDVSNPKIIAFRFQAWAAGQDGFNLRPAWGSFSCLRLEANSTSIVVLVGPDKTPINTPFDIGTLGPCEGPGPDLTLGRPNYSAATNLGFFLWRDDNFNWFVRATAGGNYSNWVGNMTSSQPYTNVTPFSIEAHDTFDATTNPSVVNFNLQTWNNGEDGYNFTFPQGASVCLNLGTPQNGIVTVGANNTPVTTPFNIATLQPCN